MRIAHVNKYFYGRGGADQYMLALMKLQEEAGHVTAPFSMHHPKNLPTVWQEFFVSEMKTDAGPKKILDAIQQIKRMFWSREAYKAAGNFFDAFQPDVVHAHNVYTQLSPSVLRAAQDRGIPVVMTVHDFGIMSANYAYWSGEDSMPNRPLGLFETARSRFVKGSFAATLISDAILRVQNTLRYYENNIDRFIVASDFLSDLLKKHGFSGEKIVKLPLFARELGALHSEERKDEGYVLFFGRLEKAKAAQTLIEALKDVSSVSVKIAGTGTYEHELKRLALGIPHITFLGHLDGEALAETLRGARVVVVPSLMYETFGLSAFEAMQAGVPVIVSDRGALPELIEDGVSGTVVPGNDPAVLREAVMEYVRDAEFAASVGEAAMARAREIGDPKRHLERIFAVYSEVLEMYSH